MIFLGVSELGFEAELTSQLELVEVFSAVVTSEFSFLLTVTLLHTCCGIV